LLIQNRSISANTAAGISFAPNTSDTADRSAIIYGVNESGGSGNATGLTFHTNANGSSPQEKARIDSSGRLGLGTSSPGSYDFDGPTVLAVANTAGSSTLAVVSDAASLGQIAFADGTSSTARYRGLIKYNHSTDSLEIRTAAAPAVTIDSSQRVGIGTTSPRGALDVTGSIFASGGSQIQITGSAGSTGLQLIGQDSAESLIGTMSSQALAFRTDSTERARLDSSGRLLVGTSSGSGNAKLQIQGGVAYGDAYLDLCFNGTVVSGQTLGELRFTDAASSANVYAKIAVQADAAPGSGDYPGRLVFSTTADGASSPTERMKIDSAGTVEINGTKNADSYLYIEATTDKGGCVRINHTENAATFRKIQHFYRVGTEVGSISISNSATNFNTSSDYRLKENVVPLTGAADRLNQLQVHRFNFIANPDTTVDGFIAHEVQTIVPECITGTKDELDDEGNPVYQGIDQSKLVPLLTAALQEALAKIETLEAKVAALEGA